MEKRLGPIARIFALNTDLTRNCLAGISEAQANQRLPAGGNSIAFLLMHLADARHYLLDLLGEGIPNPLGEAMSDVESIDEVQQMPSLAELVEAWEAVSSHLAEVMERVGPEELDRVTAQDFPIAGGKVFDAATFLVQHDSYHLGQIGFLRRQLALPAMSYEREAGTGAS